MKLLMTMKANGKDIKVYGTNRKDVTTPVTTKTGDVEHTFDNVLKFWEFVQPMNVSNIHQVK